MSRRLFGSFSIAALLAAASLLAATAQASAAEIANGNFEAGSFVGWGVNDLTGASRWTVAERKPIEEGGRFGFPAGTADHVAITEYNGADTAILSREPRLPNVSLTATPIPQPAAAPILAPPAALTPGRLTLDRGTGSGRLAVTLPGPGTLTVSDARRKVAVASAWASVASKARPRPILIRTATAQTTGAQTVRVPIRPTAAAKKLLRENGRLPFRLRLTFAPESGTVSTESYKGTLLKRLRPVRR